MRKLEIIAAAFIASAGAACNMSDVSSTPDAIALTGGPEDFINPRLLWIRASGPNSERDPKAVPVYEAIFAHDHIRLAALLDNGGSPNLALYAGHMSPLAIAIALNDVDGAKVLVTRGADIDGVSGVVRPSTPLAFALDYGRFYTIDDPTFAAFHYLIEAGADVNKEYNNRNIAIDAAGGGYMLLLNEILDHGFNRDLSGLKRVVESRLLHGDDLKEKTMVVSRIDTIIKSLQVE